MIVTKDDMEECKTLKEYLTKEIEMKDLRPFKYFLEILVLRSKLSMFLFQ